MRLLLLLTACSSPSTSDRRPGYPEPFGQSVFLGNSITARYAADSSANVHLVDMNAFLRSVVESGYRFGGTGPTYSATVATGGLFSLDGVHPSPRGHWAIANRRIESVNLVLGSKLIGYSDL